MYQPGQLHGSDEAAPLRTTSLNYHSQLSTVTSVGKIIFQLLVVMALLATSFQLQARDSGSFLDLLKGPEIEQRYLYTSLYTKHYDPKPEHVNKQNMLGFENEYEHNRLWGLAMFDNSFGQESQYLYVGKKWSAFYTDRWYYKVTGGLLHGYEGRYEDKIPLNDLGVAPAIIPAIGYRDKSVFAEFTQLGLSAGLITIGVAF